MLTTRLALTACAGLVLLAGCGSVDRQAASETESVGDQPSASQPSASQPSASQPSASQPSADVPDNPVGSLWWTMDVAACVVNHTSSAIPVTWYQRTSGDTDAVIMPGGRSCARDGHSALSLDHSDAQVQISINNRSYWVFFENPPVGRPDVGVWRGYQSDVIVSASLSEPGSAQWNVDGHSLTVQRLNDSDDAKQLELHIYS